MNFDKKKCLSSKKKWILDPVRYEITRTTVNMDGTLNTFYTIFVVLNK